VTNGGNEAVTMSLTGLGLALSPNSLTVPQGMNRSFMITPTTSGPINTKVQFAATSGTICNSDTLLLLVER
jgi:hypothetical protein